MKIEIKNGQVLNEVANVCQVDVMRLAMKSCRGGFTVLLDHERSLGRYNGKKRLFTLTQYGQALTNDESEISKIQRSLEELERRLKTAGPAADAADAANAADAVELPAWCKRFDNRNIS